jgi:hypothetical protein
MIRRVACRPFMPAVRNPSRQREDATFASLTDSSPSLASPTTSISGSSSSMPPEPAAHQAVIIHQQYCDLLFHKTPAFSLLLPGSFLRSSGLLDAPGVHPPSGGREKNWICPPINSERSRIATRPMPRYLALRESRLRDPPLPIQAHRPGNAIAPRPASRRNAAPHYSALPAHPIDMCTPRVAVHGKGSPAFS